MDIYTPYTYLIGWSKQNKFYYGRRTAKNCHPKEFWIKGQIPWNKGRTGVYSEESTNKIRESKLGISRPDSVKLALSNSKKGRVCCIDIETKTKILIDAEEFNNGKGSRYFGVASKKGKEILMNIST